MRSQRPSPVPPQRPMPPSPIPDPAPRPPPSPPRISLRRLVARGEALLFWARAWMFRMAAGLPVEQAVPREPMTAGRSAGATRAETRHRVLIEAARAVKATVGRREIGAALLTQKDHPIRTIPSPLRGYLPTALVRNQPARDVSWFRTPNLARRVAPPQHAALFPLSSARTARQRSRRLFSTRVRLVQGVGDEPARKVVPRFGVLLQSSDDHIHDFRIRGAGRNAGTPAPDRVVTAIHCIRNAGHITKTDLNSWKFAMCEQSCPGLEPCVRARRTRRSDQCNGGDQCSKHAESPSSETAAYEHTQICGSLTDQRMASAVPEEAASRTGDGRGRSRHTRQEPLSRPSACSFDVTHPPP